MLDQHPDAPEQHSNEMLRLGLQRPHDTLDLTDAWPKMVKRHPRIKLMLVTMLVSTGELEPTEPACLPLLPAR